MVTSGSGQWECHGGIHQDWILGYKGVYAYLRARHSGIALAVEGGKKTEGANIVKWTFNKHKSQLWRLAR